MAAMDGLMAGIMGGMMGAMLGAMLLPSSSNIMVLFVDTLFVLVKFLLLQLIEEESGAFKKHTEQPKRRRPLIANPIFLIAVLAFMGVLTWGKAGVNEVKSSHPPHELTSNYQEARITISSTGYLPQNLELKAGVPTKLTFFAEPDSG